MKKLLSLVLCLVLAVGLFVGCGDDSSTDGSNLTSDGVVISKADVKFIESGESVYSIIRPESTTELEEVTPAAFIFKQFKGVFNANIKNQNDKEDGADKYEILIGATNRPESQQALDYIEAQGKGRYNDWIICTIGKKIVINAYNAESLNTAAKYFVENFLKADGVKGGIEYMYCETGDFVDIKINDVNIKNFKIVRPYFNFSYLAQLEVDALVETVFTKSGYKTSVVFDQKAAPQDYEIIIGNANRDGVEAITDHDAYSIKISGKKVYINGGSAHATAVAVSEFTKLVANGTVTDTAVNGSYGETIASYGDDTLKYVWGDDFDGDTLDTTKWYQKKGMEDSAEGQHGKLSVRSDNPDHVYVRDGKFYICGAQDENYYYGAKLNTTESMAYKYGYAEISAIVPHGPSFWVAFWASRSISMNASTPSNTDPNSPMWLRPEIDIMEMFGNSSSYAANGHRWPTATGIAMGHEHTSLDGALYGQSKKYTHPEAGGRLTDDFHTYGFLWDNTQISFTCDGELFFKYDTTTKEEDIECFNHEMYLIISLALGFASQSADIATATEEEWTKTNKFIIDYCNVYQKNDGISYIRYLK